MRNIFVRYSQDTHIRFLGGSRWGIAHPGSASGWGSAGCSAGLRLGGWAGSGWGLPWLRHAFIGLLAHWLIGLKFASFSH